MGAHMKTTIDIADDVLARAKREARRQGKTLREVVDEALRQRLVRRPARPVFHLKKHPFMGEGLQPGVSDWDVVRDMIYRLG